MIFYGEYRQMSSGYIKYFDSRSKTRLDGRMVHRAQRFRFSVVILLVGGVGALQSPALARAEDRTPSPTAPGAEAGQPDARELRPINFPYNMARARMGSKIRVFGTEPTPIYAIDLTGEKIDENTSEHALISDDMTVGYPLKAEAISLVFELPYSCSINTFNFFNFGGAGQATIYGSTRAPNRQGAGDWQRLAEPIPFQADGVHGIRFEATPMRYFKAEFTRARDGRVGGFGLFGDLYPGRIDQVTTFRAPVDEVPLHRIINNNLASVYNGANVVYVSSGRQFENRQPTEARLKIDDNAETYYDFSPEDRMPTGVIDLGDVRPLKRVSWLFQSVPGRFDFYISHQLPDEFIVEGERTSADPLITGVRPEFFERNPAFHTIYTSQTQGGRLAHNFKDIRARYVVIRFVPDEAVAMLAPVSTLKLNSFHVFGNFDPLAEPPPDVVVPENFPDVQVVSP
jgi:hypothetical protein